ncbi:hypothetical protein CDD82_2205 [Ophiocordyceps australis]|uniref:DUF1917 domain-containing protein n=1 Tax=Ophiocordyceps australis TaxID=1399860 RepID=A0A2C5Y1Z3_9HYPO|nr:hypothetical protein CDD82_2205 [Ophiocordyceps australis]
MDSEDSDFHGNQQIQEHLYERVGKFDVQEWLQSYKANAGRPLPQQETTIKEADGLHNPYRGISYAWQLTESVDDFLARLSPSRTEQNETTPWIFICNPFISRLDKTNSGEIVKGSEDEAPGEEGQHLRLVVNGGMERLNLIKDLEDKLQQAGKSQPVIKREMSLERKRAVSDILSLAHAARVRTGKWLLFCEPTEVDDIWEAVARATADNKLGIAAKVAPKCPEHGDRRQQLLCVYTADFNDKADVGRVLQYLRKLKLFKAKETIYYKPDVYTYVGLSQGNPWGLRASIYTSRDFSLAK